MIEKFLRWSAFPMEKPPAYGAFHLSFLFIGLTIIIILALLLRKSNEKQNNIILFCFGLFLLLTEIYKQLFYYYVMADHAYQWWIFPFQLCSIPMYLCLLVPFIKTQSVKRTIYNFLLAFNLMSGFVAFLEPSGLVHEYWPLTLHAFIWHMMLIFIGLYLGLSKRAGLKIKEYINAFFLFLVTCIIALIINLIFYDISNGSINMFYVGPAISPIIVFKSIATNYGWYVNTPIYILCLTLAAFLFYLPFCLVNKNREKNYN